MKARVLDLPIGRGDATRLVPFRAVTFRQSARLRWCASCGGSLSPGSHGFLPVREALRQVSGGGGYCRKCGLSLAGGPDGHQG